MGKHLIIDCKTGERTIVDRPPMNHGEPTKDIKVKIEDVDKAVKYMKQQGWISDGN